MTSLHLSALHGNEKLFHLALQQNPNINIRESFLGTPLCCVVRGDTPNHARILAYLLQHNADPHLCGSDGQTPLHLAASHGQSYAIDQLLETEVDINATDEKNMTPLHHAVSNGDLAILGKLLKAGVDIDVHLQFKDEYFTILQFCVLKGNSKTFQALLDHGARMELRDSFGSSPLHTASLHAVNTEGMAFLNFILDQGADVNVPNSSGYTPIFHAISRGLPDVVRALIDHGADTNATRVSDKIPLHTAASQGHEPIVRLLLEHGADINAIDSDGATATHKAITHGHVGVVQVLLQSGADITYLDGLGETYLHKAAQAGSIAMAKLFLDAGIGIDLLDTVGSSALCEAIQAPHQHMVDYLIGNGADREITKKFYFGVKALAPDGSYVSSMLLRRDKLPPEHELYQRAGEEAE